MGASISNCCKKLRGRKTTKESRSSSNIIPDKNSQSSSLQKLANIESHLFFLPQRFLVESKNKIVKSQILPAAHQNLQLLEVPQEHQPKSKSRTPSPNNQDDYFGSSDSQEEFDTLQPDQIRNLEPISWDQGQLIGQGSFGRVYQAMNTKTGQMMAVKQVDLRGLDDQILKKRVKALRHEIDILSQLKHHNIVSYLGSEVTSTHFNIFLEYVAGGSISSLISKFGNLQEKLVALYIVQILAGLNYLHSKGIMHRDIKGANVLVDKNGVCKLADFGSSKALSDLIQTDFNHSLTGTPNWMAPEVINQDSSGRKADIWSLGCLIIEMTTGQPPWGIFSNPIQVLYKIATSTEPPPFPENLSVLGQDFLSKCLQRNPADRWTAKRLLKHPFLIQVPREKLRMKNSRNNMSSIGSILQVSEREVTFEKGSRKQLDSMQNNQMCLEQLIPHHLRTRTFSNVLAVQQQQIYLDEMVEEEKTQKVCDDVIFNFDNVEQSKPDEEKPQSKDLDDAQIKDLLKKQKVGNEDNCQDEHSSAHAMPMSMVKKNFIFINQESNTFQVKSQPSVCDNETPKKK